MSEQQYFRQRAVTMAHIQARHLLRATGSLRIEVALPHATGLIRDCMHHLNQPALAVEVALGLRAMVERWSAWPSWSVALDLLLASDLQFCTAVQRFELLIARSLAARGLDDHVTAVTMAKRALELAGDLGEPRLEARALSSLGVTAMYQDDLATGHAYLSQAYEHGQCHLLPLEMGNTCLDLGTIATQQGQFVDAHRFFDEALRHYQAQPDPVPLAKLWCNQVELLRREGRLEHAVTTLMAARDIFDAVGARYDYALVENDIGCVYLTQQQWEQALHAFERAVAEFEQIGSLHGKAWVLSNIAELYVTTGQWERAEAVLTEGIELALLCERHLLMAYLETDRGRMLAAQGDTEGAREIWIRCLETQQARGARVAAQQTERLLATLLAEES